MKYLNEFILLRHRHYFVVTGVLMVLFFVKTNGKKAKQRGKKKNKTNQTKKPLIKDIFIVSV